jgi:hypothetical protein
MGGEDSNDDKSYNENVNDGAKVVSCR